MAYIGIILSSIFAGFLIGIGGIANLKVSGVIGAVLFSFGFLSIIVFKSHLFTGKAGFLPYRETHHLLTILLFNVVGCALASEVFVAIAPAESVINLAEIINFRTSTSRLGLWMSSVLTGLIMSVAVYSASHDKFIPLLIGVPLFILCGFPHCIADAFYYISYFRYGFSISELTPVWIISVIGNYIGCNIPRWFRNSLF